MRQGPLTNEQVTRWNEDGYLLIPQLFGRDEIDLLLRIAKSDKEMIAKANGRKDTQGGVSKLALRNDLYDDTYSAFVRCRRVVDRMDQLLDDEIYHFHHKMMLKEPYVGGAWEWHQDYGYWYANNYCLYPDMGSCLIAIDRATKENGCLQVFARQSQDRPHQPRRGRRPGRRRHGEGRGRDEAARAGLL